MMMMMMMMIIIIIIIIIMMIIITTTNNKIVIISHEPTHMYHSPFHHSFMSFSYTSMPSYFPLFNVPFTFYTTHSKSVLLTMATVS